MRKGLSAMAMFRPRKMKPFGRQKAERQSSLLENISRRRAKSRIGDGRGAGESSRPVVIDLESSDEEQEGDPYVFLNTQSNEVEPERSSMTENECKTPRTEAKPHQTPTIPSRRVTPRGKSSPAAEMERLLRQEKMELQLAIEASKKESEREERRRRYKRREAKAGKAEAEEQQQRLDEFQQTLKKVDDAMESVMAAETLTLESTRKKADQDSSNHTEVAPMKSAVKSANSNPEDEWSQATPPLANKPMGTSSPRNLKLVLVEKLRAHSVTSHIKKDTCSEHEESLQSGHEEMSVEKGLVGETDGMNTHLVSVAQSSSEGDISRPCDKGSQSGDETPPLLFQNEPHNQLQKLSEYDAQPRDALTKEGGGGRGDHMEVAHLEKADIPPVSASGHLMTQQKKSKDQRYLGGEVVGIGGGGGHPPTIEMGHLPDHSTAVEILSSMTRETPSRACKSLKRSRKRDTKPMECKKEVEQPKAMLGHDLEETMDTSAPQIGKEKLDQDVSPEVKKSRLDQTEPVTEASADTQLAHSGHKDHSVVECPTNSEQDGQRMPDVHEEQSNVRKQNGNISASILLVEAKGMEQLDSSAPKGNNLQKPGKGAELHSSPKQQAKTPKKVLRGRRGDTKTATRPTKQLPSKSAGSNPPPLLFAHSGKPPSKYTPTIVQSFDDYFTQLWHAQRQVLHRLTWGDPVLVHSKQPSGTLDLQRKRKRVESIPGNLETTPKRWPDVGTARSPISGWLLQKSTHQEPSVGGENPVDVQSDFRNAGPFVHARIENTPGRRTLRLKRRPLSCREAEEGEPNISKLSVKGDFSIAERPIEVSRLDVPEAATVEYDLDEMLVSRNDESLQPSCSPKFPPQDTQNDDVVLITQTVACDTHSGTSHRSPNYNSSSSCATECSQNQQYKIQEQHTHTPDSIAGVSAASATPSNEEWITRKSRKPVHPSQNSTKELTRPVLHSSSRKRKRAHFMDESETEPEDDGGQDGHRAKRCSMGHEFQPTHLQRKSITPSNADDSSTEIESGPETLAVLPSSTSRHPQLPPLLFSIGSATRGRRRKREEATPTRKTLDKTAHLQCQAASVIDLTEDTQAGTTAMPTSGDISPAENLSEKEDLDGGTIECPICHKGFHQAVIEEHAAECNGIGSGDEASTGQRNSPLRIRSTTRDQWAGDVETASVSSGEGSEWEERSGGETGDHDGDPTHAEGFSHDPSPTCTGKYEANITTDRSSSAGPQLYQSEDGGYIVDPTTISNSPIRTFTRIRDLTPQERVGYHNQFRRSSSGAGRLYGEASRSNTWGRSDFDELLSDHGRSTRGRSRGRGRGRRGGWQHQRGNYHHYRKRGSNYKH